MSKSNMNIFFCLGLCLLFSACSSSERPEPQYEYYTVRTRQLPPAPVYSRVAWSHLPEPIPGQAAKKSPYLLPVISFELPNSNLEEAIEALAQTMGYDWVYPEDVKKRPVSIHLKGTVEEVLSEIARQAQVSAEFDHNSRLVRVNDPNLEPKLPN